TARPVAGTGVCPLGQPLAGAMCTVGIRVRVGGGRAGFEPKPALSGSFAISPQPVKVTSSIPASRKPVNRSLTTMQESLRPVRVGVQPVREALLALQDLLGGQALRGRIRGRHAARGRILPVGLRSAGPEFVHARGAASTAMTSSANPATARPACTTTTPFGIGSAFQWKLRFRNAPPAAATTNNRSAQPAKTGKPTVKYAKARSVIAAAASKPCSIASGAGGALPAKTRPAMTRPPSAAMASSAQAVFMTRAASMISLLVGTCGSLTLPSTRVGAMPHRSEGCLCLILLGSIATAPNRRHRYESHFENHDGRVRAGIRDAGRRPDHFLRG